LPGDIIAFDKVTLKGETYTQTFSQHYAIVYKILDDGVIEIAHQNYNNIRTVGINNLNPSHLSKGKLTFFRPQPRS